MLYTIIIYNKHFLEGNCMTNAYFNLNHADSRMARGGYIPKYTLKSTGTFLDDLDKERKEVLFVLLGMSRSRILWAKYDPKEKEKKAPLCSAKNATTPDRGSAMQPGPCTSCPKSKWNRTPQGQNERPECNEVYSLLCWDIVCNKNFIYEVKGIRMKALKDYRNRIRTEGLTYQKGEYPIEICCVSKLSAIVEKTVYGDQFAPCISIEGGLSVDKIPLMEKIMKTLHSQFAQGNPEENELAEPATSATPFVPKPSEMGEPPF